MASAVQVRFGRAVQLRVDRAFTSCAGPLMSRAGVTVLDSDGEIIAKTPAAPLSPQPEWHWSFSFALPATSSCSELSLRVFDVLTGKFLGQGKLSLHIQPEGPYQIMLEPRFLRDGEIDPRDDELLQHFKVDDFGYLAGSLSVRSVPTGPESLSAGRIPNLQVKFPIGCCLKAILLSSNADAAAKVFATFGSAIGEYPLGSASPLFVSVGSATDSVVYFRCSLVDGVEARAQFNLPLHAVGATVDVALPVCRIGDVADGNVLAVLLIKCCVLASPNFPSDAPPVVDFGRAPPDVPQGLFHAATWESEAHIARATERRWRRSMAVEAIPQQDHVRHLHDVVTGKSELSTSMVPLVRAFFNLTPNGGTATCDLRQLMCALAFCCQGISASDAALFVFDVLCIKASNGDKVVGINELCFLLEHALLPKTLDMSASDVKRRCADLILLWSAEGLRTESGALLFTLGSFASMIANNGGLWAALGSTLEAPTSQSAPVEFSAPSGEEGSWRHMVIRVPSTKKAFAVTAHADDTFRQVTRQIESAVGIGSAKQVLLMDRTTVDFDSRVGALVPPSTQPVTEIVVTEADETVKLLLVYRAKNLKWEVPLPASEKVLKLRALVQQKTNIPLSRVTLTLGTSQLSDRHALSHYGVFDGVVIDVVSSA